MAKKEENKQSVLADMPPAKAIVKLAVPATIALLAKAVYNLVDTAYIGMLDSDIALTAVGVTVPLLLIMVSIENIFAAGGAVLAGRQLGAKDDEAASRTVTTIIGISIIIGVVLCVCGIIFIEPIMRAFGASDASLPLAEDYAFWMFIAALANLPAQSMNCAARAESSAKISSIAVITGALLNVALDPIFMFDWGLDMGVEGASLATTVSQFVTFFILIWFYASGRSIIKIKPKAFHPTWWLIKNVVLIGIP
ncbi:MAG: MATE family efflux transporter, partial [Eubacterium sp.]